MTLTGNNGSHQSSVVVGRSFAKKVRSLQRQTVVTSTEYGSLDGTLIQLSNDPLRDDGVAKLRDGNADIICHAVPQMAAEMARYLNRKSRIVVYGDITYENGGPKRIQVESFVVIPSENDIPTLDDLHAIKLRPPGGKSVEDYLDELRGDE